MSYIFQTPLNLLELLTDHIENISFFSFPLHYHGPTAPLSVQKQGWWMMGFRQVSFPPAYSLPNTDNLLQILFYCPFPSSPNNNDILESLR